MTGHLTDNAKITRVSNAVAAGTSDSNSSSVDMQGFEAVAFVALFGTLTATQVTSMKLQQSSDDGSSDGWSDIEESSTAAMADGDSNKMLAVDDIKPTKRYVRAVIDRGTANAVIDGVVAIQYRSREAPITKSSTMVEQNQIHSRDEGTA